MLHCGIHKLTDSVWNKEELEQRKRKSVIVPIYKNGDITDRSNYSELSMLPTT
jgi:hypothetical protein